jgi:integrative and conjugative element protein (TIGR02256 family)
MSLFLTPSGGDLVFLGEDHARTIRLDDLEMQHYRAAYRNEFLQGHLEAAGKHLRYGASCRDVTLPLAQTHAAIFSGIGARALRSALQSETAAITIWRLQHDSSVTAVNVKAEPVRSASLHAWTVRADDGVLKRLHTLRRRHRRTETGGALIGHRDMQRRILYVVHALPAPKDSQEGIAFFERGCEGLQEDVAKYARLTGGALTYIGEWHSHPPRCPVTPSERDLRLFEWLRARLQLDGVPPVMAIVGDNEIGMYVSEPNGGALWNTQDL